MAEYAIFTVRKMIYLCLVMVNIEIFLLHCFRIEGFRFVVKRIYRD